MARFRVRVWRELFADDPTEDRVVDAAGYHAAAAWVLRAIGGGHADWIRVDRQSDGKVVRYLDASYGPSFDYDVCYEG